MGLFDLFRKKAPPAPMRELSNRIEDVPKSPNVSKPSDMPTSFIEQDYCTEEELRKLFDFALYSFHASDPEERRFFEEARGSETLRLAWLDDKDRTEAAIARGVRFNFKKTYAEFVTFLEEDYSSKEWFESHIKNVGYPR